MIYWKEECQGLVKSHSVVVLVDRYDENRIPVFAIRRVQLRWAVVAVRTPIGVWLLTSR